MKFNKILFLIILLCVCITLIGCGTPEGFDSDLWRDSKKVVKIIKHAYNKKDNFSVKEEEFIDNYFDKYENRVYNNFDEHEIIINIKEIYKNYNIYVFSMATFDDEKVIKLMEDNFKKSFQNLKDNYKNLVK